jgi:Raf kinase inhibitor-like YbhB/YbcL family protein
MKKITLILFLVLCAFHTKIFAAAKFALTSSAFQLNTMIPAQYTCNGADKSPPLTWNNIPAKTQSLVLIMQDPDTPQGVWTHWVLFNIPVNVTHLDASSPVPEGAANGINSWNGLGYRGPCPPIGAHRYVFKLYAIDTVLSLGEGATADTVLNKITAHVLGTAELIGLYQK